MRQRRLAGRRPCLRPRHGRPRLFSHRWRSVPLPTPLLPFAACCLDSDVAIPLPSFSRRRLPALPEERRLLAVRRLQVRRPRPPPLVVVVRAGGRPPSRHLHRSPGESSPALLACLSASTRLTPSISSPVALQAFRPQSWPHSDQEHAPVLVVGAHTIVGACPPLLLLLPVLSPAAR